MLQVPGAGQGRSDPAGACEIASFDRGRGFSAAAASRHSLRLTGLRWAISVTGVRGRPGSPVVRGGCDEWFGSRCERSDGLWPDLQILCAPDLRVPERAAQLPQRRLLADQVHGSVPTRLANCGGERDERARPCALRSLRPSCPQARRRLARFSLCRCASSRRSIPRALLDRTTARCRRISRGRRALV